MGIINAYKILLEKSEDMTNFGRARWEGDMRTTFKDTVCKDMNCKTFVSKQARKVNYVLRNEYSSFIKAGNFSARSTTEDLSLY
jgi:hypothetical protein